eukprot:m.917502 g.917502  ORF g.917502 m.917502 type:complete len:717 (+) comp60172_c0_seq13:11235-13385(+)
MWPAPVRARTLVITGSARVWAYVADSLRARSTSRLVFARTNSSRPEKVAQALPPTYSPAHVEADWSDWWIANGFFSPTYPPANSRLGDEPDRPKFVMMLPPPNVTGSLHIGHALTNSIQDAIVRWHRMSGHETLWLPGCDHAGIATQSVVERELMRTTGMTRHALGRQEFLSRVWQWKQEKGDYIYEQMKLLGSSLDWSRAAFTMDEGFSRAVTEAFVRLHEQGLVHRGVRPVNWCCHLQSALSDIEVDWLTVEGATKITVPSKEEVEVGVMYKFAYKVAEGSGAEEELVVSTTRPETMLGDVAVAVHSRDPRYLHLHGKYVVHPFTKKLLPIICDDQLVDPALGTGVVKITPFHDTANFLCAQRNNLPLHGQVIGFDGKMTDSAGAFKGLSRFAARHQVLTALEAANLLRGQHNHAMSVPICSRSGDLIEPMICPQWYVRCGEMSQRAIEAAQSGELQFYPPSFASTFEQWLSSGRDWCVSRQLWWGHRIPAYYAVSEQESSVESPDRWIVARTEAEALMQAKARFGAQATVRQDEDVLDTWFSSGLFPFATLGWPKKTSDLAAYYPGHLLETGQDILFFWVARMVMLGLQLTDQLPFKQVLLHAMVRDAQGRKMSKSLGNVIDPLDIIKGVSLDQLLARIDESNLSESEKETAKLSQRDSYPAGIPACGTDALRFTLCAYTSQVQRGQIDDKSLTLTQRWKESLAFWLLTIVRE